jgi:hypothetical protein
MTDAQSHSRTMATSHETSGQPTGDKESTTGSSDWISCMREAAFSFKPSEEQAKLAGSRFTGVAPDFLERQWKAAFGLTPSVQTTTTTADGDFIAR